MLSRLILLKSQYISDLERMQFTYQGLQITSQLPMQECPFCHSKVFLEDSEETVKHLDKEYKAERERIQELLHGLDPVIEKAEMRVNILSERYSTLLTQIREITSQIDYITNAQITPLSEIVEKYTYYNKLISDKEILGKDIVTTNEELEKEKEKLEEKAEESTYKPESSIEQEIEFCQIIKDILRIWSVSAQTVTLTPKKQDICIDGQERITNGKGYRALYFSAFIYAVHEYLQQHERPSFPCIMLDSPLTTLRGEDKTKTEDTQAVNKDIQDSMCLYIAKINNVQSIILENKEIKDDIASQAKVIRFTHSKEQGRFGLFPVK